MKVKIGETWYSAEDQPLSVQFTDEEMDLVRSMTRDNSPNLRFTAGHADTDDQLLEWAKAP